MSKKNTYWIITGFLALFTSLLHLIGGQLTVVNPMLESNMLAQSRTEMLGAWHIVTVILFLSSYYFLRFGFGKYEYHPKAFIQLLSFSFIAFGLVFIIVSLTEGPFAPQWIILIPIGILGLVGLKKNITA